MEYVAWATGSCCASDIRCEELSSCNLTDNSLSRCTPSSGIKYSRPFFICLGLTLIYAGNDISSPFSLIVTSQPSSLSGVYRSTSPVCTSNVISKIAFLSPQNNLLNNERLSFTATSNANDCGFVNEVSIFISLFAWPASLNRKSFSITTTETSDCNDFLSVS